MESHLLQMRGLKQYQHVSCAYIIKVASFTDAWIETDQARACAFSSCRIFYRCVD